MKFRKFSEPAGNSDQLSRNPSGGEKISQKVLDSFVVLLYTSTLAR